MTNTIYHDVLKAVANEPTHAIPIAFWGGAPFSTKLLKVKEIEYYQNTDCKLATFQRMFEMFPEVIFFPGIWPDFGTVAIPSAFGAKIQWHEEDAPHAYPCLQSINDIDRIKPANPKQDGLLPNALGEWEYFWKHVDRKWIDEYGYLDGTAFIMGTVESAAMMRGYSEFFLDMIEHPGKVHKLLDIVTDTALAYLREQEKINGSLKRIMVGDHLVTQISPDHCKEFYVPYTSRIFNEFSNAEIKLWHNEGRCSHVYDQIPDLGCNVWQFGDDDALEAKDALQGKVTLMGNIKTVDHLLKGTPEQVGDATKSLLTAMGKDGGFLLSSAGGMSPGTSYENVRALIDAAR
ncbi:MAG: hypothetical protein MI862_25920 [Desulfobacterales bacterium]|nr:hypothetical protein [Desulfobacterales bacterium]